MLSGMEEKKLNFSKETLRLYAVTDRSWLCGRTLEHDVEEVLKGGVTLLQLREKQADTASFVREALAMRQITARYQVPLIINDRVDVLLESGADGVHIGQGDGDASLIRRQIGPDKILGVSARTVEQARAAEKQGADYIGVGAVFGTSTKADAQTISPALLRQIAESVQIPVVAIGGISARNILLLKGCKMAGVAVVSALFAQKDPQAAAKDLLALSREICENDK